MKITAPDSCLVYHHGKNKYVSLEGLRNRNSSYRVYNPQIQNTQVLTN